MINYCTSTKAFELNIPLPTFRYERFERYRLRAMRAQVANRAQPLENPTRPALPSSSQAQQLSLPSSGVGSASGSSCGSGSGAPLALTGPKSDQGEDPGEVNDDDDVELLDAIAEQTQVFIALSRST